MTHACLMHVNKPYVFKNIARSMGFDRAAGHGKSALVQHVLQLVRADDGARSTVLVAQSSVRRSPM